MGDILVAIVDAELWQLAIAVLVIIAGSSAASALIQSAFTSRTASKDFRRQVRAQALEALGNAYVLYLQYGNASAVAVMDPLRDGTLATASAKLHVAIAQTGDTGLMPGVQQFVILGELFASQNEDTGYAVVEALFTEIATSIAKSIPGK
jgi:hypothetical protein